MEVQTDIVVLEYVDVDTDDACAALASEGTLGGLGEASQ